MMTVKNETVQYPDRGALVSDMCGLLKAARTPLSKEWEPVFLVPGSLAEDHDGHHDPRRPSHVASPGTLDR
jgi:hypothetical protein